VEERQCLALLFSCSSIRITNKPALRPKNLSIIPPDGCIDVDGPGEEDDQCVFWDGGGEDGGGADGLAEGRWDGGVEAEDFGGEGVEVGEGGDLIGGGG
jgi:hypothetical protein